MIDRLTDPRAAPLLALAVLGIDASMRVLRPPYLATGILDEPAHLATTAVIVSGVTALLAPRWRPAPDAVAATLVTSVLIDLDHVPQLLGWQGLTVGTPRPYPHAALTVGVLCAAALNVARSSDRARRLLLAAAAGVTIHLFRDLATAPVALWWPWSLARVTVPYAGYAAILLLTAALARLLDEAG